MDLISKLKDWISDNDKIQLNNLIETEWWAVLVRLCDIHKIWLWQSLIWLDVNNKNSINDIVAKQNYLNAFENILSIPYKNKKDDIIYSSELDDI